MGVCFNFKACAVCAALMRASVDKQADSSMSTAAAAEPHLGQAAMHGRGGKELDGSKVVASLPALVRQRRHLQAG